MRSNSAGAFIYYSTITLLLGHAWGGQQPAVGQTPATTPAEAGAAAATDATEKLGKTWVQLAHDEQGEPTAMQIATVRYRGEWSGRPVTVDLVGAVHVGDAAYYRELNQQFKQYDALLYELVAPEGTVVDAQSAGRSANPISVLQGGMKSLLELEHQLEKINYRAANFVHADMTPDEFFQSMQQRGEGVLSMLFRMMGQTIAAQSEQQAKGQSTDIDLVMALFASDRARRLKIVFAEQMLNMESTLSGFGGKQGSTIITERNKAALRVLRRELDAGKRKLGVFYGAAHLSDMDERLQSEFRLKPVSITWLDAWDLAAK